MMDKKEEKADIVTTETQVVKCVPYQLCPKCNGNGQIINTWGSMYSNCDVCNGDRIIPMHILNQSEIE